MNTTTNGKADIDPDHGKDVTFTVHDEDDGASGTFTVKRGSRLADAIGAAYAAVKRTPAEGDQLKADGTGTPITADAHDTVAAYLAHGGVLVWLISGPTGGATL
ncbi:hypothetical protein UB45_10895 [Terrabacter sp. 28]|nr:hypothetical protein UB45_10895 [Terrabacter sp. 28]